MNKECRERIANQVVDVFTDLVEQGCYPSVGKIEDLLHATQVIVNEANYSARDPWENETREEATP